MNEEIKVEWLADLRSGQIPQRPNRLADEDGPARCCLGVLADIAVRHGVISGYHSFRTDLPAEVAEWAGLPLDFAGDVDTDPVLQDADGERHSASSWNDDYGFTFPQIADLIERSL